MEHYPRWVQARRQARQQHAQPASGQLTGTQQTPRYINRECSTADDVGSLMTAAAPTPHHLVVTVPAGRSRGGAAGRAAPRAVGPVLPAAAVPVGHPVRPAGRPVPPAGRPVRPVDRPLGAGREGPAAAAGREALPAAAGRGALPAAAGREAPAAAAGPATGAPPAAPRAAAGSAPPSAPGPEAARFRCPPRPAWGRSDRPRPSHRPTIPATAPGSCLPAPEPVRHSTLQPPPRRPQHAWLVSAAAAPVARQGTRSGCASMRSCGCPRLAAEPPCPAL